MMIFLDDEDRLRFLDTLLRFKKECEFELYAFCLMGNHIHLELKEISVAIQVFMHKIGVSYVHYFNNKYDRVGPLFQGRFKSEEIETTEYLLWCMRYIHNNPVAAGLVMYAEDYSWSSYQHYLGKLDTRGLIDSDFLLGHFSANRAEAVQMLSKFTKEKNEDCFIDWDVDYRAVKRMREYSQAISDVIKKHKISLEDLRTTSDIVTRNRVLQELKNVSGASSRELAKLVGLSKDIIFRA